MITSPPPKACAPDNIAPLLNKTDQPGDYTRLGFRVPFVVVSPFVKHHFVSHEVADHTSILKYIETKFNLPALTLRDANASALSDFFDYAHPTYASHLPLAEVDAGRMCR